MDPSFSEVIALEFIKLATYVTTPIPGTKISPLDAGLIGGALYGVYLTFESAIESFQKAQGRKEDEIERKRIEDVCHPLRRTPEEQKARSAAQSRSREP